MTLDKLDKIENGLIEFMQFEYKHYNIMVRFGVGDIISSGKSETAPQPIESIQLKFPVSLGLPRLQKEEYTVWH